jgi:hypothetical protein
MRVAIAIQACILILNLPHEWYDDFSEIIVYPAEFVPKYEWEDEFGVVHQSAEPHAGESWLGGPVVLSWADAARSNEDGVNVVIHEFAHKLDMLGGAVNGCPLLHSSMSRAHWHSAFNSAYEHFRRRTEQGEDTLIDPYAAESPAEFFAVLSEAFFERPEIVREPYPQVYEQLAEFYRQDPFSRHVAAGVLRVRE